MTSTNPSTDWSGSLAEILVSDLKKPIAFLAIQDSGSLGVHLLGVYYSSWRCLTSSSRWVPVVERDGLTTNRS